MKCQCRAFRGFKADQGKRHDCEVAVAQASFIWTSFDRFADRGSPSQNLIIQRLLRGREGRHLEGEDKEIPRGEGTYMFM